MNQFLVHFQYYFLSRPYIPVESLNTLKDILEAFKPSTKLNRDNYEEVFQQTLSEQNSGEPAEERHPEVYEESKAEPLDEVLNEASLGDSSSDDEEFDHEFSAMVEECSREAKGKETIKEKAIPVVFRDSGSTSSFKVLVKVGTKLQAKPISVPEDNMLFGHAVERRRVQEQARESMLKTVLDYKDRLDS